MDNVFDKITVVIPSVHKAEEKDALLQDMANKAGVPIDIVFVAENAEGLTTIFQRELDKSNNDIVLFVHDDVTFLSKNWGKKLIELFSQNKEYGILGVAGTKVYGKDNTLGWWQNNSNYGMLFHGNEEKSWITMFSEYQLNSDITEVVAVDGVFIACVKSRLSSGFDASIEGFHFYDIDFCLSNFINRACKIGVTNKIAIMHESGGKPNEQWILNGQKVFEKYKKNFPLRVK